MNVTTSHGVINHNPTIQNIRSPKVGVDVQRSVESQRGNVRRRCKMAALVILRATQIKTYSWGNAQVVLVGNKVDLEEERQVPTEDAQRLATELGQHAHTHAYYTAARVSAHPSL